MRLTVSKSMRLGMTARPSGVGGRAVGDAVRESLDAPGPAARCLAFCPGNPNYFVVGTSSGYILHASRLGNPPPPRVYRGRRRALGCRRRSGLVVGGGSLRTDAESVGEEVADRHGSCTEEWEATAVGAITCVSFSPFFQRYFLAGCGDGRVCLYKVRGRL